MAIQETKRYKGLKNCGFIPIEVAADGTETYGEYISIPGIVTVSFEPEGEDEKYYANDMVFDMDEATGTYNTTVTMAHVPDKLAVECLGQSLDEDGMLFEKNGTPKKDAVLIFQTTGSKSGRIFQFFKCALNKIGGEFGTNTDKSTSNEIEVSLVASANADGYIRNAIDKDHPKYAQALNTVCLPNEKAETPEQG